MLVADETAVPSVAAILDAWGGPGDARDQGVEVHVEVADPAVLAAYDLGRGDASTAAPGGPGSALVPALERALAAGGGPVEYAWVCGEAGLAAGARRVLRRARCRPPRASSTCGYWKLGRPRP